MHRFTVTGINHKTAPIELREKFNFTADKVRDALAQIRERDHFSEAVILSTCNRVEIYGVAPGDEPARMESVAEFLSGFHGIASEDVRPSLYHHEAEDAVRHLFQVVSGLDAMALGETEIFAQTKDAFSLSVDVNATGKSLNVLFQKAFAVAKKIHTETAISTSKVSVASVAVDFASELFSRFADKTLLILGAGAMGQLALTHFRELGVETVMVANRTYEKAREAAAACGGTAFPLENISEYLHRADLVVAALETQQHLITPALMTSALRQRRNRPVFLLDLSVPRAVHPEVQDVSNAFLYDLDSLQDVVNANLQSRQSELARCLAMIDDHAQRFMSEASAWEAAPLIADIHREVEAIRADELQRLSNRLKDLPGVDERVQQEIEQATRRMANKILHRPITQLRAEANNGHGYQVVNLMRKLFLGGAPAPPDEDPESGR